jgi:hypothetical protein
MFIIILFLLLFISYKFSHIHIIIIYLVKVFTYSYCLTLDCIVRPFSFFPPAFFSSLHLTAALAVLIMYPIFLRKNERWILKFYNHAPAIFFMFSYWSY